jgi:hypothetical protein
MIRNNLVERQPWLYPEQKHCREWYAGFHAAMSHAPGAEIKNPQGRNRTLRIGTRRLILIRPPALEGTKVMTEAGLLAHGAVTPKR